VLLLLLLLLLLVPGPAEAAGGTLVSCPAPGGPSDILLVTLVFSVVDETSLLVAALSAVATAVALL
jgi:hypothetical protein